MRPQEQPLRNSIRPESLPPDELGFRTALAGLATAGIILLTAALSFAILLPTGVSPIDRGENTSFGPLAVVVLFVLIPAGFAVGGAIPLRLLGVEFILGMIIVASTLYSAVLFVYVVHSRVGPQGFDNILQLIGTTLLLSAGGSVAVALSWRDWRHYGRSPTILIIAVSTAAFVVQMVPPGDAFFSGTGAWLILMAGLASWTSFATLARFQAP